MNWLIFAITPVTCKKKKKKESFANAHGLVGPEKNKIWHLKFGT